MALTKDRKDKSQKKDKVEKKEHKSEKAQKASALAAAEKLDPTISNLFANSVCLASELHLYNRKADSSSSVSQNPSTPRSPLNLPGPPRRRTRTMKRREMTTTKSFPNSTTTS